jgi:asparagine synthase (glutamine-hydrolysing)
VPLFYLSKATREAGIKVVETGEGSDELFLGYDSRLHALQAFERRGRILSHVPRQLLPTLATCMRLAGAVSSRMGRYSEAVSDFNHRRLPMFQVTAFGRNNSNDWLADMTKWTAEKAPQSTINALHIRLLRAFPRADIGTQASYLDLKLRLAEMLLMRTDKITMSVGLEARVPFLDYKLVEFVTSLPLSIKVPGWDPKHLLKSALRGIVPDQIIQRPKQIFFAPVNLWLRRGMQRFAEDLFKGSRLFQRGLLREGVWKYLLNEHLSEKRDRGGELWTLMVLCAWYDRWIEQPTRPVGMPIASAV